MKSLGVYIHIPFCIRKCNYCDFCSFPDKSGGLMHSYTDEIVRRMKIFAELHPEYTVDTVYFGGGTPTLLPIACFEKLMLEMRDSFSLAQNAEISVECNPATIDKDGLAALLKLGINRLSIGLQSADEKELKALGRLHSFEDFCRCYTDARDVGFDNVSIDLMYGIPEQTLESFENTLRDVIALSPDHISAYGLKIEDGTVFGKIRDRLTLPDEDEEFAMYRLCKDLLLENGYERYEISNFSKKGRESRHNLRYWQLSDYIGFGVAAHSLVDGVRFGNSRDIDAFLRGEDITEERAEISNEERIREYVMLGLRLESGISREEYFAISGRELGADMPDIEKFIRGKLLAEKNGRIAFTDEGFFVSNAVLSALLFPQGE